MLYAAELTPGQSGFRFWKDLNADHLVQPNELGPDRAGTAPDIDFVVERNGVGGLRLRPVRAGTGVEFYGNAPVGDLTDIDWAPDQVYSSAPIDAPRRLGVRLRDGRPATRLPATAPSGSATSGRTTSSSTGPIRPIPATRS